MLVMPHFVSKHRHNFVLCHLLHQGIVQNDGFHLAKAAKIGICLGRPLRTVSYADLPHSTTVLFQQLCQPGTKAALLQRGQLIKNPGKHRLQEGTSEALSPWWAGSVPLMEPCVPDGPV